MYDSNDFEWNYPSTFQPTLEDSILDSCEQLFSEFESTPHQPLSPGKLFESDSPHSQDNVSVQHQPQPSKPKKRKRSCSNDSSRPSKKKSLSKEEKDKLRLKELDSLPSLTKEQKDERKKVYNRITARESRQRNKSHIKKLEEKVEQLTRENKLIKEENQKLKDALNKQNRYSPARSLDSESEEKHFYAKSLIPLGLIICIFAALFLAILASDASAPQHLSGPLIEKVESSLGIEPYNSQDAYWQKESLIQSDAYQPLSVFTRQKAPNQDLVIGQQPSGQDKTFRQTVLYMPSEESFPKGGFLYCPSPLVPMTDDFNSTNSDSFTRLMAPIEVFSLGGWKITKLAHYEFMENEMRRVGHAFHRESQLIPPHNAQKTIIE